MIDETQLSSASTTKLKNKQQKQPPHNNRPKQPFLKDSNTSSFKQTSFSMKIAKKKVRMQSPLVNPIIDLKRLLEKTLKKGEYIAIKC